MLGEKGDVAALDGDAAGDPVALLKGLVLFMRAAALSGETLEFPKRTFVGDAFARDEVDKPPTLVSVFAFPLVPLLPSLRFDTDGERANEGLRGAADEGFGPSLERVVGEYMLKDVFKYLCDFSCEIIPKCGEKDEPVFMYLKCSVRIHQYFARAFFAVVYFMVCVSGVSGERLVLQ